MTINGTTWYCPPNTRSVSIYNGSMTCDGNPATTYCDDSIYVDCNNFGPYYGDTSEANDLFDKDH
jgi:hypothetical protein